MKNNKNYFVIFLFFASFIFIYYNAKKGSLSLKKYFKITSCEIISHETGGKGSGSFYYINYDFLVNKINYSNYNSYNSSDLPKKYFNKLINEHFFVAYDSTNPQNSEILLLPNDFVKYKIKYPDSLRYFFNNFK